MSIAILRCRALSGTEAPEVTIEVFLSGGLPGFSIVGMAETAVRESKDRVRGALMSSGFRFPQERITVSLGPADMKKTGGRFDLAIALGILAASRQLTGACLDQLEFYGELGLDGGLRPAPGMLPAALRARDAGNDIVVAAGNAAEASLAGGKVFAATTLLEVTAHLHGVAELAAVEPGSADVNPAACPDLVDVRGQSHAKRALEVAAAGGHNLLLVGPPGTGKSMLAERLPGLLPPMSEAEAIETAAVESVMGRPPELQRWRVRPFRSPHHTASAAALVGGGREPRPGEVSRAHNGVLFLDELPEFNRNVLEALREPIEAGRITISRATGQAEFPARFQLVAAMNPCPCGYLGDPVSDCGCSAERVAAYRGKLSGPLLDRIDLKVDVGRLPRELLRNKDPNAEASATVRARVAEARQRQVQRAGRRNADLKGERLETDCEPDADGMRLLDRAAESFALSVRAYQRVLRVARTIADLDGDGSVGARAVAEALNLRGASVR
ncbi:MAG: YifB family Mg chelatase-like AAA ATPase [Woeseiaceae bacterium]|nr:YifB family Mg chelatase-like AAA ATPase [Woeseiaceae bacterium]